jgi:hypothetical protein
MPSIIKVDQIQSDTGNVAFTGNIAFPAGSATLPSIQPVGDTNTGIFFPAADTIAFAEGGVESGRFNSSGNFGLGTSSPSSSYIVRFLHISDATSAGVVFSGPRKFSAYSTSSSSFIIIDDDAAGATRMGIDSSGNFSFNSGYGSAATAYGCRAWVNFNGTGTVAIRASGNVSSITDNGTGDYTVNFTNAMPDANYTVTGGTEGQSDPGPIFPYAASGSGTAVTLVSTTQCRVRTTGPADATFNTIIFHR